MCVQCRYDYGNVVVEYPQFYCKEPGEGEDELSLIFTVSSSSAENYRLDFNFNPVIRVCVHRILQILSQDFNDQQYTISPAMIHTPHQV